MIAAKVRQFVFIFVLSIDNFASMIVNITLQHCI